MKEALVSIAIGHPLGASGARLLTTAIQPVACLRSALRVMHHVHRRRPGDCRRFERC
jgi:hypothetical protein